MTTVAYAKEPDFTAGDDETGMQTAASGDLIGSSHGDDDPPEATLPGSPQIGEEEEEDVYAEV